MPKPDALLTGSLPAQVEQYLNERYTIDVNIRRSYQRDGFIKLEQVLSGMTLDYIRRLIGVAVAHYTSGDMRPLHEKSRYEQSFLQCKYLCWQYPAVKELVFSRRLAGMARDLMGCRSVRLWHDQALYKQPGGRITDGHQDLSYWPLQGGETGTIWMALTDVDEESGCMAFHPGSHTSGTREYVDIFEEPHQPQAFKASQPVPVPLRAGDATFHSGLTFHQAYANHSDQMREAMTIIYVEDGIRYAADDPRNADHTSCEGLTHGDVVDTRFTPKLI